MSLNKIRIVWLSLVLAIMTSTNCFASTKTQEMKKLEFDKTIAIEDIEQYKNNIENEIVVDGIKYQLSDIQEQENKITKTKYKEEKEQLIVKSSDKYSVLKQFEKEKTIEDDGYTGILELQTDSLDLKTNDSYLEQYKVQIQRQYNNVLENELNYVPKTIEQDGIIYYLTDPVWNVAQTQEVDGQEIPLLYNGVMNYEGIKERRIIKNYIATIEYNGTLHKEVVESINYHLTYKEVQEEEKTNNIIPIVVTTTTGIIIFSGIVILRRKNIYIYNYENKNWKLVKKLHISKNERLVDITPIVPSSSIKYKIVLSRKLYNDLINSSITIKYFDKQYIYEIKEKEFEIYV